jgi:adenylate kinase family enzyme
MQRVLIIGQPGAGKSTLGRELARITGLPLVHLDRHYWQPGWTDSDPEAWTATVRRLVAEPRWIIEGNYAGSLPLRLARADTVIHLDFPRWLCFARVVRRILWGKRPGELPPGCPERFDGEFLRYTWTYRRLHRAKDTQALAGFTGRLHRFASPRSLRDFTHGLGNRPPAHPFEGHAPDR